MATAVFRYAPAVVLRDDLIRRMSPDQRAEWVASDPNDILRYDDASGAVTLGDIEAYAYDGEVVQKAADMGFPGAVEIEQRQDTFIFTVEATGALRPTEMCESAAGRAGRVAHVLSSPYALPPPPPAAWRSRSTSSNSSWRAWLAR